jgi:protoporphyrinogen/coproporphyrinogen III oxidase
MSRSNRWIVVGGGASGLAAAFFLKQLGMNAVIVERGDTLGGRMGAINLGERSLDGGGKNIGRQYKYFRQFVASLGTHRFEYFGLNSTQIVDGKVKTFDARARWRTLVGMTRGLSVSDVLRFGHLLWRVKSDEAAGYLGSTLSRSLGTRYDHRALSRYFSPEFCRRVVRPMSVRMNGAEPDEIYMGNLGTNVRMILDTYEQLEHGLAPLLRDVQERYDVRLGTAAEALLVKRGGVSGVRVKSMDGSTTELQGAGVILATPAPTSATLVDAILPDLATRLRKVAYYPVTLIVAEYDRPIFSSDARAFVFGDHLAVSNAGAYGINDLHVVRYTFSGRTAREYLAHSVDAERLLQIGEDALSRHIPCDAAWRRRFVARHFNPGLCAYTPYHGKFLDSVEQALRGVTGLYLTGDYMQGASIEACFRSAAACVRQLAQEQDRAATHGVGALLELHTQREG